MKKSFSVVKWKKHFLANADWNSWHLLVHVLLFADFLLLLLLQDAALLLGDADRCVPWDPADGEQGLSVGADGPDAIQIQLPVDLLPHLPNLQHSDTIEVLIKVESNLQL